MVKFKKAVCVLMSVLMVSSPLTEVQAAGGTTVKINPNKAVMNVNDELTFSLDGTDEIPTWKSKNDKIATIKTDNTQTKEVTAKEVTVKAVKAGSTKIGATYKQPSGSNKTIWRNVTVKAPSTKLNKSSATVYLGVKKTVKGKEVDAYNTVKIKATIKGKETKAENITWKSSNSKVAKVEVIKNKKGNDTYEVLVTAVGKGKAVISATANGKTAECVVNVNKPSISLDMSNVKLSTKGNGRKYKLKATVVGPTKGVKWETSDKNICKVSGGMVTATTKTGGTATITATANGVSKTCTVEVIDGFVALKEKQISLYASPKKNETKKLTAYKFDKKKTLEWISDNESVAKVDKNGKVTAVGGGKATITVKCDGKEQDKCIVKVTNNTVRLSQNNVVLSKEKGNNTFKLKATVNGKSKSVKWKSSDRTVVTVSGGKLTAKKAGTATITAESTVYGIKAECTVEVTDIASCKKHEFGDWVEIETATPDKEGKEMHKCKNCGKEETRTIEKTESSEYNLVWSDNFTGTELNRNDWNVELHEPGWVNAEWQEYVDSTENIMIRDNTLVIKPVKKVDENGNVSYTSGRVNTQNKHNFKYGKFEARVKMPTGKGYLPAFWLMSANENLYGQWPRCGEIDIAEVMGHENNKLYGTIHYGNPHRESQGTYILNNSNYTDEYHVFSCEWEPGKISWYMDGIKYHEENDWYSTTEGQGTISYPAPFDQPFYIILNLAVGGSWVGYPDETTDFENAEYVIDYVKVYQKDFYDENVEKPKKEVVLREPDENGNYINNSDFAKTESLEDDTDWKFMTANEGVATAQIADGCMNIKTENSGIVDYSVQLVQANVPFEKGATYEVKFDAKASESRTMRADIKAPDYGYAAYMPTMNVNLTTEFQTFTQTFKMTNDSDGNGRLEFNMGAAGSTADITIDNVSVKKTVEADPNEKEPKTILSDGNHVYNGSFQEGDKYLGYWEITNDVNADIAVTGLEDGRRLKVTADKAESTADKVKVAQTELALAAGKEYELSFDAQADTAKSMKVIVAGQEYSAELTTETKNYIFKFKTGTELTNKDISFDMGLAGTIYLDNVRLVEDALIKNGSFNAGMAGYEVFVDGSVTASSVVDSINEDNALDFSIEKTGNQNWYIQLKQNNVILEKDQWYTLSFDIKSSIDRSIQYSIQRDGSKHKDANGNEDWTPYVQDTVKLTAYGEANNYTTVSKTFQMKEGTDTGSIFNIALGGYDITEKHRVCIDNITLVKAEAPARTPLEIGTELLKNKDFDSGMDNWAETIANWGPEYSTDAGSTIADGVLTYDIKNPGTEDWHVQLKQSGLQMDNGDAYRITMDIESSAERTIVTGIMHATNYSQYGQLTKKLEANKKVTLTKDFIANEDNDAADFYISLGKIAGEETPAAVIKISNLSVKKINKEDVKEDEPTVEPTPEVDGNMLKNGDFSKGKENWESYINADASASAEESFENNTAKFDIKNVGKANSDVQLKQGGLTVEAGKRYNVKFKVKSSASRKIEISFLDPQNGWDWYGGSTIELNADEEKAVDVTIDVSADKKNSSTIEFQICMGQVGDEATAASVVEISEVSIKKLGDAEEKTGEEVEPAEDATEEETETEEEPTTEEETETEEEPTTEEETETEEEPTTEEETETEEESKTEEETETEEESTGKEETETKEEPTTEKETETKEEPTTEEETRTEESTVEE